VPTMNSNAGTSLQNEPKPIDFAVVGESLNKFLVATGNNSRASGQQSTGALWVLVNYF
jgi:hypothetical protein